VKYEYKTTQNCGDWNYLNPVYWFQEGMEWINGKTEKQREWMVNNNVPSFNVGYNSAQGPFHSVGNSGNIYHNQVAANSPQAIMDRTTVTFNNGINQDGINFVNNLGVSYDNVNVVYPVDQTGVPENLRRCAMCHSPEGMYYDQLAGYREAFWLNVSIVAGFAFQGISAIAMTTTSSYSFGRTLFLSENFGVTSTRFGSSFANAQGTLNQSGSFIKAGWSSSSIQGGGMRFRIGIGRSTSNPNIARFHGYVPRTFVPNSFANPSIQLKNSLYNLGL